jgi:tetraacyldisaccharide 4'-kinase
MIYPFSWLYGLGVRTRNALFQWAILKEQEFPLPVICIGNLTIGGTGKTPHTEYLIRLLNGHRVAVLSRGYGRKTHGFILANDKSTAAEIGDEPFQIHQKFPQTSVAVDEKRVEGIHLLIKEVNPDVILLDDAFQHRYVKAGLNILLTDYNRLITRDALLPAGKLREPVSGKNRAHLIIVTKCPSADFPAHHPQIGSSAPLHCVYILLSTIQIFLRLFQTRNAYLFSCVLLSSFQMLVYTSFCTEDNR